MNQMDLSDSEAVLSAQRCAMRPDIPTARAMAANAVPSLTKAELTDLLVDRAGLNRREAKEMFEAFFAVIRDVLESGESVKLSGFGNFQLRDRRQRPGKNPKTGETIPIPPRCVVTFHASQKVKARLETGGEQLRRD